MSRRREGLSVPSHIVPLLFCSASHSITTPILPSTGLVETCGWTSSTFQRHPHIKLLVRLLTEKRSSSSLEQPIDVLTIPQTTGQVSTIGGPYFVAASTPPPHGPAIAALYSSLS